MTGKPASTKHSSARCSVSERMRQRSDLEARQLINDFGEQLDFDEQLEELAIAPEAWQQVVDAQIDPKTGFRPSLCS